MGVRRVAHAYEDPAICPTTLGNVELRRITPDLLRSWLADMADEGLSASRMARAKRVVSAVLSQAVADGLIGRNPAETVKVPKTPEREPRYLTAASVTDLADACEHRMTGAGVLVKVQAYAGLRWGEAVALRGRDVDVLRRRLHVRQSATLVNGNLVWGPPKTHRARTIVIPRFLAVERPRMSTVMGSCSRHREEHRCAPRASCARCGSRP